MRREQINYMKEKCAENFWEGKMQSGSGRNSKTLHSRTVYRRALCLGLSAAMVLTACGSTEDKADIGMTAEEEAKQEQILDQVLNAQVDRSHSSESGKEETVYVLADAKGGTNQVIVSNWLKNSDGSGSLSDWSELKDIENVKGYETFKTDEKGNITWEANGADIYYRGSTDKELPVEVKISYQLDGKEITPEELAGKNGKVTIRMDYENKASKKIEVGGKEQEAKVPFAMISGMILPQDKFSDIQVTNARILSEGNNSVVIGVAFPGLKESIDMDDIRDRLKNEDEEKNPLEDVEIPDYIEVTADVIDFELGMTMTVAMSDVLSDINLTDSFDLSDLNDSMDELQDAANQLKDGTVDLKDGSRKLKDGTEELLSGTNDLWDGTAELKDGTQELYEKSGILDDGAAALLDGTNQLQDGVWQLNSGAGQLQDGGARLLEGTSSLVTGAKALDDGAQQLSAGIAAAQQGVDQLIYLMDVGIPIPNTNMEAESILAIAGRLAGVTTSMQADLEAANENASRTAAVALSVMEEQIGETQARRDEAAAELAGLEGELESRRGSLESSLQNSDSTTVKVLSGDVYYDSQTVTISAVNEETGEEEDDEITVQVEKPDYEERTFETVDTGEIAGAAESYREIAEEAAACRAKIAVYDQQIESMQQAYAAVAAETVMTTDGADAYVQIPGDAQILYGALAQLDQGLKRLKGAEGLQALSAGADQLKAGTASAVSGARELNSGAGELKSGIDTLKDGAGQLADGAGSLRAGAEELKDGTGQLVDGTDTLNNGAGELQDGVTTLKDGVLTLDDGMGTLDEGALELLDGMFEFDEEGINRLTEMFGDDVQDVVDRLQAVSDLGKEYNTFTGLPQGMNGSVKFIIRTESVK